MKNDTKPEFVFEDKTVFKRHWFKHFSRYFFSFLIVGLNIFTALSTVERYRKGVAMPIEMQIWNYLFLIFIDLFMLLPMVLEANTVEITPEYMYLKMLYFNKKLAWKDIESFKEWPFLIYTAVKSRGCFYLINRREIKGFPKLAEIITERVPSIESK